jgi:hypothetical protein
MHECCPLVAPFSFERKKKDTIGEKKKKTIQSTANRGDKRGKKAASNKRGSESGEGEKK